MPGGGKSPRVNDLVKSRRAVVRYKGERGRGLRNRDLRARIAPRNRDVGIDVPRRGEGRKLHASTAPVEVSLSLPTRIDPSVPQTIACSRGAERKRTSVPDGVAYPLRGPGFIPGIIRGELLRHFRRAMGHLTSSFAIRAPFYSKFN